MTEENGYIISEPEYPRRGKRISNMVGTIERDPEEGWVWYIASKKKR